MHRWTGHILRKERLFVPVLGVVLTLLVAFVYLYEPTFFRSLDNKFYDTLLRYSRSHVLPKAPVIIDVDDKSLNQFGQWPWPRYRISLLLRKLRELGAASVALDMVFPEADRTSLESVQKDVFRDLKVTIDMGQIPGEFMDNDKMLANEISRGPLVLGYKFIFGDEENASEECLLYPINVIVANPTKISVQDQFLFRGRNPVCNLKILSEAARSTGFINIAFDLDGILRRAPLLIERDGRFHPSLSLAALMKARQITQVTLTMGPSGVDSVQLDKTIIPLDPKGNLVINYRGKGKTFKYISASDVLSNRVAREEIAGQIVFIGTSAAGIGDFFSTPLDNFFPGVEVHATIIDNILKKDFYSRPSWMPGLELILIIGFGIFSTLLLSWTRAAWSLLILVLCAIGLMSCSYWILKAGGIFLSPLMSLITLGTNFSLLTLLKYRQEEKRANARKKELLLTQDFTIRCLASVVEMRDRETGQHILRTQRYVKTLCQQLAAHPKFREYLTPATIDHFFKSAPLHDIGKVGVSDHILLKPGKLTSDEFAAMQKHAKFGFDTIDRAERRFGSGANSAFLRVAKEMAFTHHEKWDGTGYPQGLKGEDIPVAGRIMAVADVYDALICRRPYKPPFTHEDAVKIIGELKGISFDPEVVEAFMEIHEEFKRITVELADEELYDIA
jgi:HD-GYP domain-containing protein (c-di-GMP phosphodiesterase class II)